MSVGSRGVTRRKRIASEEEGEGIETGVEEKEAEKMGRVM